MFNRAVRLWVGDAPPENSFGDDDDFFLDGELQVLYGPKFAGVWPDGIALGGGGGGGTSDHRALSHRNDANQHTTAAITGLDAALADLAQANVDQDTNAATSFAALEAYADQGDATSVETAETYSDGQLAEHAGSTTGVHGIADTSALETTTGAQAKADAKVSNAPYDATTWNGDATHAPSKDATRDQFEVVVASVSGEASARAAADSAHAAIVDGSAHGINGLIATAVANLVASSPASLDTLKELADALGDDPNFAATVTAALGGKVPTTRTVNGHALSADVTVTKGDVGLGNADNTSDANKPVSAATQAALDLKADTSQAIAFALALG